jgi:hypothetical protein
MDQLTQVAVATAMRKMFDNKWFDISTVDQCLKLAGVIAPTKPYQTLRVLHCVHYSDMPRELLDALPGLLRECFGGVNIEALMQACEPAKQITSSPLRRLLN